MNLRGKEDNDSGLENGKGTIVEVYLLFRAKTGALNLLFRENLMQSRLLFRE